MPAVHPKTSAAVADISTILVGGGKTRNELYDWWTQLGRDAGVLKDAVKWMVDNRLAIEHPLGATKMVILASEYTGDRGRPAGGDAPAEKPRTWTPGSSKSDRPLTPAVAPAPRAGAPVASSRAGAPDAAPPRIAPLGAPYDYKVPPAETKVSTAETKVLPASVWIKSAAAGELLGIGASGVLNMMYRKVLKLTKRSGPRPKDAILFDRAEVESLARSRADKRTTQPAVAAASPSDTARGDDAATDKTPAKGHTIKSYVATLPVEHFRSKLGMLERTTAFIAFLLRDHLPIGAVVGSIALVERSKLPIVASPEMEQLAASLARRLLAAGAGEVPSSD